MAVRPWQIRASALDGAAMVPDAQAERTVLEFGPGGSQGLPFDQLHGQIIRWFPEALGPLLPHRLEIYALG